MVNITDKLKKGPVLGDGGYLLELEKRGYVKAGPFTPEAVVKEPEAVEQLHREFMRAGVDVLQTFTFYGTREKLRSSESHKHMNDINRNAVRIARKIADENNRKKVLVAGNIALTWQYTPGDEDSEKETRKAIREQVELQDKEGVDFFLVETVDYLGEALIALDEVKRTGKPCMITFMIKNSEKLKDGFNVVNACKKLDEQGVDIVGINCQRDPERTLPVMKKIVDEVDCYTAAQPSAYKCTEKTKYFWALKYKGRKAFPLELDPFQLSRFDMAQFAREAKEMGIDYIGSCCGSVAAHVRAMAEVLGKKGEAFRFKADLSVHPVFGKGKYFKERDKDVIKRARK
ncbi:MAG: homocysteine S-methyltransferase family protein [Nanobdellota archaeon]